MINAKPPGLIDACWTRDAVPRKIEEPQLRVGTTCSALYPPAPAPREVAGASVASDVIKCQLKTIDPADYRIAFTPAQQDRLSRIFPSGVCDWSRPGIEQQPLLGTWIDFDGSAPIAGQGPESDD